jgi:uncharacterized membrane protein YecN with MAPEG domain
VKGIACPVELYFDFPDKLKAIRIPMITSIYASLSALLIVSLSVAVIKLRRKNRVSVGDGGNEELQLAIRAHSNALEYIPITLLLLLTLELNGAPKILIHVLGATLLIGRILHAMGLPAKDLKKRVLGMQITIYLLIGLAVLNILFLALAGPLKL